MLVRLASLVIKVEGSAARLVAHRLFGHIFNLKSDIILMTSHLALLFCYCFILLSVFLFYF